MDHLPEIVMLIRTLAYRVSILCTNLIANYTQIKKNIQPEPSFPHSKVLVTFSYHESVRSSPYPTFLFLKTHLNIILLLHRLYPKWFLSLRFPPTHCIGLFSTLYSYMRQASHFFRFDHPKSIQQNNQIS